MGGTRSSSATTSGRRRSCSANSRAHARRDRVRERAQRTFRPALSAQTGCRTGCSWVRYEEFVEGVLRAVLKGIDSPYAFGMPQIATTLGLAEAWGEPAQQDRDRAIYSA